MKKVIGLIIGIVLILAGICAIVVCNLPQKNDESWKEKGFDLSLPTLGENGW